MLVRRWPLSTRGVLGLALVLGACSSGGGPDAADHCELVIEAVEAGALADDLIGPAGGPVALRERLEYVLAALEPVAATAPSEQATDWRLLRDALGAAEEALDGYGYDLVSLATTDTEDAVALVNLGGDATTELRIRLADDVAERCGVDVETPTRSFGLPRSTDEAGDDLDPRVVDPLELPPERLAGLLARTFEPDELDAAFAAADVDSVSELADRLLDDDTASISVLVDQLVDRVQIGERGDDERLDAMWDACEEGDDTACDLLAFLAPPGSAYEAAGLSCGGRREGSGAEPCSELELR